MFTVSRKDAVAICEAFGNKKASTWSEGKLIYMLETLSELADVDDGELDEVPEGERLRRILRTVYNAQGYIRIVK